jgi:hypothetical protein
MKDWQTYSLYVFAFVSGFIIGGLSYCFLFSIFSLLFVDVFNR